MASAFMIPYLVADGGVPQGRADSLWEASDGPMLF